MKLNVLSDLHLSRGHLPYPDNDADAVILAGDVGRPEAAIEWACGLGKPVIYVPGNHEFYGSSLRGTIARMKALAAGTGICILDDSEVCIAGVRFLGSTLWTDFRLFGDGEGREKAVSEALLRMHDFRRIYLDEEQQRCFTPLDAALLFGRHSAWLEFSLKRPFDGPTVVITHHAPSARSIEPRFEGSPLNACFASRAEHLLDGGRAALWIHGHMHHSVDYELQGTRVVSNPRGYVVAGANENPRFDVNFMVEVNGCHLSQRRASKQ